MIALSQQLTRPSETSATLLVLSASPLDRAEVLHPLLFPNIASTTEF